MQLASIVKFRTALFTANFLLLALYLGAASTAHAQLPGFGQTPPPLKQSKKQAKQAATQHTGEKPSIEPAARIPVEPLGFSAPSSYYLGQRATMASLDFLDESHLLFTFRVPGLLKRDTNYDEGQDGGERQIRAIVLELPSGNIAAEDLWTLHDRAAYVWPLTDGRFLLRVGRELKEGDLNLKLFPRLRFPGIVSSIGLSPNANYLVSNSHEPLKADDKKSGASNQEANQNADQSPDPRAAADDYAIRVFDRATGKVLLVSRAHGTVRLPINSTGYVQALRDHGTDWSVNLYHFDGGVTTLGYLESICMPELEFLADNLIAATTCVNSDQTRLTAITTEGRHLWEINSPSGTIWPHMVRSSNGLRVARESLAINRSLSSSAPLDPDEVKSQRVTIYDSATGHVALTATANPILDVGGNVAISPSGSAVAILSNGEILLWNLPAPPTIPPAALTSTSGAQVTKNIPKVN